MRILLTVVLLTFSFGGPLPLLASDDLKHQNVIKIFNSVADAVEHIVETLERQGFEIPLIVDHSAAALSIGQELNPTQVIFARQTPSIERRLLRSSATIGIDIPFKFLIFEKNGEVQVTFNSVGYLFDRHALSLMSPPMTRLGNSLRQFSGQENGLITVESLQDFEETVSSLRAAIASNPAFRIPLVLDYDSSNKKRSFHNKHRLPVLIIFGNPNAGTPLMQTEQRIGIDLPQEFLVSEDDRGRVKITYNDPFFIASRHNVKGHGARLGAIAGALSKFALLGAGKN